VTAYQELKRIIAWLRIKRLSKKRLVINSAHDVQMKWNTPDYQPADWLLRSEARIELELNDAMREYRANYDYTAE